MIWLLQRTVSPLYGRLHNAWTVLRSVAQRRDHRPPAWQDLVDANALIVSPLLGIRRKAQVVASDLAWSGLECLFNALQGCTGYLWIWSQNDSPSGIRGFRCHWKKCATRVTDLTHRLITVYFVSQMQIFTFKIQYTSKFEPNVGIYFLFGLKWDFP